MVIMIQPHFLFFDLVKLLIHIITTVNTNTITDYDTITICNCIKHSVEYPTTPVSYTIPP